MTPSRPLEAPTTTTNASMPCDTPEPRYRHFQVRYSSGTEIDSYWLIAGGGTLRAVQVEHPMALVEADEESRIEAP
jgi:hypothetical protein